MATTLPLKLLLPNLDGVNAGLVPASEEWVLKNWVLRALMGADFCREREREVGLEKTRVLE